MTALFTRLALHVRSACDEWVERIEDSQTGHRDRRGRKTQKWYEREYEIERRRKKRQAKRREKQKLEGNGGQKQEGKRKESGGGGKEQSKTKKVTAVMTGALGPIEEGGAITTGSDPVEGTVTAEGHEGGSDPRDEYSPMPSEHSVSSTQAQVHSQRAYERSRSKTKSGSVHGAPKDSEDEEASGSSDEESFPENKGDDKTAKAGKAAKKSEAPAGDGKAGSSTGLRGGGVCGIAELDGEDDDEDKWYSSGEEEYHEHEALDDEYATPGKNPQMDGDTVDNQRGDGVKKHAGTEASESTLAQRAAEPANRESQEVANGDRRCDDENKRHNGRDVSTVAMEPAQPEYENAREDKRNPLESKITGEGYKGSLSPSVPDEATIRKLEPYVNGVEQAASKPPSRESRPYSESRGGTRTEDHIAIQPDGKRFDREPRPYDLPEVCERLKVQRPQAPAKPGESLRIIQLSLSLVRLTRQQA